MARSKNNIITKGLSGRIGKDTVFKNINGETFNGKYPDRSHVKYSKEQIKCKKLFSEAAKHASKIISDPAKKAAYKTNGRFSVYHAAIKDYISRQAGKPRNIRQVKKIIHQHLEHPDLNNRQIKAIKYMAKCITISNAVYQRLTGASKPTATRDLQELVRLKIFSSPKAKGAGAAYSLVNP
jgi:hypothetical protein